MSNMPDFQIRSATTTDVPVILQLIHELAEYERAPDHVFATPDGLQAALFGATPAAEVLLGEEAGETVGFALFFPQFLDLGGTARALPGRSFRAPRGARERLRQGFTR